MKRPAFVLAAALLALHPSPGAAQPRAAVDLRWLAGCWELTRANGDRVQEIWEQPTGDSIAGRAQVFRPARGDAPARRLNAERTWIRVRAGVIEYEAQPEGQARAVFTADSAGAAHLSFVNPAHDFPQRITYRRVSADSLVASIGGPGRGGSWRTIAYPFARGSCTWLEPPEARP